MKEPSTPLPYNCVFHDDEFHLLNEETDIYVAQFMYYKEEEKQEALQDMYYVQQAANNFPRAIELLYQSLDYIRDFGSDTSHMYNNIRQYLNQLEDEN